MILILKKIRQTIQKVDLNLKHQGFFGFLILTMLLTVSITNIVFAQSSLTLSVSPTILEMTANPGQDWKSSIRVINGNSYDVNVYVDVVNFEAKGETGQPQFLPLNTGDLTGATLAEWIKPDKKEITIPAEKSVEVPFVISVPKTADPGGHFAAIMIGTKSFASEANQMAIETSQILTSLVFLRVTGDILEQGQIREFRSTNLLVEKPEMTFELRFENKGNVHLLPQGDIKIFNMWGQERGVIPVNRQTMFGNVVPGQIRKYSFSWSGEWSWADIGRYRAVATLGYGIESKHFTTSETNFWIIPWKLSLLVLGIILGFATAVTWSIKLYVRKMLTMAGVSPNLPNHSNFGVEQTNHSRILRRNKKISVVAPIEEGMLDLRARMKNSDTWREKMVGVIDFVRQYHIFFVVLIMVIIFAILIIWYVQTASEEKRAFNVTIEGVGDKVEISSEQLEYEQRKETKKDDENQILIKNETPPISIVNQSGISGLAADLRLELEMEGYIINQLSNEFSFKRDNTVIIYDPAYTNIAIDLSRQIEGALLSAFAEADPDEPIVIYVGKNFQNRVQ